MTERPDTAVEVHRPHLFGLAYRMLGAASEAEDVVQDAYMRWYAEPRDGVRNPAGFLTTTVTRLCLDHLGSARARRETYIGPWLPEPLLTDRDDGGVGTPATDPPAVTNLLMAETLSAALLMAMEQLSPLERAVYLLREAFDYSHAEVAEIVGRSETSCRQTHARARKALKAARPRFTVNQDEHRRLLDRFLDACRAGDPQKLAALLSADAVACSDGDGATGIARRTIVGPDAVAKFYIGLARQAGEGTEVIIRTVNGCPALLIVENDTLVSVVQITATAGRIHNVSAILNPAKLAHIATRLDLQTAHGR